MVVPTITSRRLPSDPGYYPTIEELLLAESDLSNFLKKANKTSLQCLIKEALSQLTHMRSGFFESVKTSLESMKEEISTNNENKGMLDSFRQASTELVNESLQKTMVEVKDEIVKSTSKRQAEVTRSVNQAHPNGVDCQIRIDVLPEAKRGSSEVHIVNQEAAKVDAVLNRFQESPTISQVRRLGKFDPDRSRPRTVLLTVSNIWEARKVLAKAPSLKSFETWKVFLSPSLGPKYLATEQKGGILSITAPIEAVFASNI